MSLKGTGNLLRNVKVAFKNIENSTMNGLIEGAKLVYDVADNSSPLIPVDLGNLRGSFFIVTSKGKVEVGRSPNFDDGRGDAAKLSSGHSTVLSGAKGQASSSTGPKIVFGFSAYYSVVVHEMVGDIKWTRPGSGPWFFQSALRRSINAILTKIAKNTRIP